MTQLTSFLEPSNNGVNVSVEGASRNIDGSHTAFIASLDVLESRSTSEKV